MNATGTNSLLLLLPTFLLLRTFLFYYTARRRTSIIPKNEERVLILGASSGIGRSVAGIYAGRGARVCVVGRREKMVEEVVEELRVQGSSDVVGVQGDFTEVGDMERVRDVLVQRTSHHSCYLNCKHNSPYRMEGSRHDSHSSRCICIATIDVACTVSRNAKDARNRWCCFQGQLYRPSASRYHFRMTLFPLCLCFRC